VSYEFIRTGDSTVQSPLRNRPHMTPPGLRISGRRAPSPNAPADPEFSDVNVAIVLPTLNEEEGLIRTIGDLPLDRLARLSSEFSGLAARLLIVDGGSTDHTLEIARTHGIPVLSQTGRGKGQGIRQALAWLHAKRVRYAVVLDADFTYPASMIPAIVHLLDSGSQLVVGVRQPVDSARNDPREAVHRVGNGLLNLAASQLSGLPILDLCSGFWGVLVEAAAPLALETDGFEIEAELFTKSYRAGYTVTQIPIPYRQRVGVAKLRALRDGARILLTSIRFGRRDLSHAVQLPPRSILRELLSIALVHGEENVVLIADTTRRPEAEGIAARLRNSAPMTRVTVTGPGGVSASGATGHPDPTGPASVVLTLPAADDRPGIPSAVVHLPRTARLIALGEPPLPTTSSDAPSVDTLARSAGYRLKLTPGGGARSTAVRAVFANLFPSDGRRELAFLGANARHGPMTLWEGGSISVAADGLEPGSPAHHPHGSHSPPDVLVDEGVR
jgi:Glycosyl transferase family 2